jgi:hypothetical protein
VDWLNHENFVYTFQTVKDLTVSKNESTCICGDRGYTLQPGIIILED